MTETTSHHVVEHGAAEAIWFLGTLAMIHGQGARTGGAFDQVEFLHPQGFATPLHIHHHSDEVFYVLDGTLHGVCDEVEWFASPGDFVWLPRGVAHGYAVYGEGTARSLAITMPAGLESFVREVGEPALALELPSPDLHPDVEYVNASAERHGITHLGPPLAHLT